MQSYVPLTLPVLQWENFVNRISRKLLELGVWYFAHSLGSMFRWLINFLANSIKLLNTITVHYCGYLVCLIPPTVL